MIDGQNFFDQSIRNNLITYDNNLITYFTDIINPYGCLLKKSIFQLKQAIDSVIYH